MIRPNRRQVHNHQRQSIVLAQTQYPRHFRFTVRDSRLLFADCLDTLRQDEQTFVDARRLDHPFLVILCTAIVLRAGQVDGGSSADANLVTGTDREFHTEDRVGA